jgi:hypothetical protein
VWCGFGEQKKEKSDSGVHCSQARLEVFLLLPMDGTLLCSGEVCGSWYYCDSPGFLRAFIRHFGFWRIWQPAWSADAATISLAPFGLLQGLGLNDPWV